MGKVSKARAWGALHMVFALLLVSSGLAFTGCRLLQGCTAAGTCSHSSTPLAAATGSLPRFDHVVVLVEENHSYDEIIGSSQAPYINSLASQGAVFTDSHAVAHPSQPNYLALFAGSTFGLTSDACPQSLTGPNLASDLLSHNMTFTSYSEDLPQAGFMGCHSGGTSASPMYARKHSPWTDFASVPASVNQPFSSFPTDYSRLPTVAFVVPNEKHDMHSGSIADGDTWLKEQLGAYVQWASQHNSLLIVTWDEDDRSANNHIPTLFIGAHVRPGKYGETISHYDVLHTIQALYGLSYTNDATTAGTIADIWQAK